MAARRHNGARRRLAEQALREQKSRQLRAIRIILALQQRGATRLVPR